MRRRKEGFSLVELLIVLAVMAALIATITPVAMNAIRKSQATKVAQNLKSLGTAFENYLYVNNSEPSAITDLGRDIDTENYGIKYASETGVYYVSVVTGEEADLETIQDALQSASQSAAASDSVMSYLTGGLDADPSNPIYYNFQFQVY
jgi:general secretion pathway protein G